MSTEPPGPAGTQPASERAESGTLPGAPVVLPLVPGIVRRPAEWRPLPDAVATAVRMLAIPDCAPPYDDELGAGGQPCQPADDASDHASHGAGQQPAGQQPAGQPPAGQPPPDRQAAPVRLARPAAQPPPDRHAPPDRQAPQAGQLPPGRQASPGRSAPPGARPGAQESQRRIAAAPPGWPGKFAQVLAETLAGARPPGQIVPWTTERARRHIQRLGPLLAAGEQPRVRRVVTFRPASDIVEMTVVVGVGPRVRALAVRLERDGPRPASPGREAQAARWVCTAVEAA